MKKIRLYAKRLPLIGLGVLLAMWGASLFGSFGWVMPAGAGKQIAVRCEQGSLQLSKSMRYELQSGPYWQAAANGPTLATSFGQLDYQRRMAAGWLVAPIPMLVVLLLPLWAGPRLKFRFQRSHLLAYSGSLVGMLAFYLRWLS